jgi:hypothetical protein
MSSTVPSGDHRRYTIKEPITTGPHSHLRICLKRLCNLQAVAPVSFLDPIDQVVGVSCTASQKTRLRRSTVSDSSNSGYDSVSLTALSATGAYNESQQEFFDTNQLLDLSDLPYLPEDTTGPAILGLQSHR